MMLPISLVHQIGSKLLKKKNEKSKHAFSPKFGQTFFQGL